ncbi:preprotein translocase subunit SecA, partial [bacterium]|nr:preprotein translocase subunit SecA [bacterium]
MLNYILGKLFGTKQARDIKRLEPISEEINRLEAEISSLTLDQLRAKTDGFKGRLSDGRTLDDILPEAFAVVREAAKRTVKMRPFDVQVMGGIVLHEGKIAEMKTGEGKTLAATMPVYLNALTGKGAHIITVNDYLAKRDSQWMRPIYETLGLKVGVIQHDMDHTQRRETYRADVIYGTNNEFGFDYLRDNMVPSKELMVQQGHHFAIVDEVDSILIDEARTPLIISGPAEESTSKYYSINRLIPSLKKDSDYQVDEKARSATLTEEGVTKAEKLLKISNLFDPKNIEFAHHVNQALKAHTLFTRDKDYLVKDGEVLIIDEFTGRLMPGRRYSDGLHQALEAKEHLKIKEENQTLASITFQNYFRMYDKLAGMTGTADTEAEEFDKIYKLEVVVIPTNEPMIRIDHPDCIYKSEREKFEAVVEEIDSLSKAGQPVLVGTISVEKSEFLSRMLKKKGTPHQVLNAKHHEREAEVVAQAGRLAAVTISTNMAGRGTDIVLGGNPQFLDHKDAKEIC